MSHVATVDIEIKDEHIDCLAKAAADCGLEWRQGQTTYKWFGQWVRDYHGGDAAYKHGIDPKNYGKCEHAMAIPGAGASQYELGVTRNKEGKLALIWDFFGSGRNLVAKIGKNGDLLAQRYAVQVALKQAKLKGMRVQERSLPNGAVQLVVQR